MEVTLPDFVGFEGRQRRQMAFVGFGGRWSRDNHNYAGRL